MPLEEVLELVGGDGELPWVLLHQVADGVLGLLVVPEGVAGGAADEGGPGLSQEGGGIVVEGADEEPLDDLGVRDVLAYALARLVGAPAGEGEVGDVGTARPWNGGAPWSRAIRVWVLPLPGPPMIWMGPSGSWAASCCRSFRSILAGAWAVVIRLSPCSAGTRPGPRGHEVRLLALGAFVDAVPLLVGAALVQVVPRCPAASAGAVSLYERGLGEAGPAAAGADVDRGCWALRAWCRRR